jgi:hypothetical protein
MQYFPGGNLSTTVTTVLAALVGRLPPEPATASTLDEDNP